MKSGVIIKAWMACIAFAAAVIIGFIALFLPPQGIIDASVLWFTAQLLVFVSGILQFDLKFDFINKVASHREKDKEQ